MLLVDLIENWVIICYTGRMKSFITRTMLLITIVVLIGAMPTNATAGQSKQARIGPCGLSLKYGLEAARYELRTNKQIGSRWLTASKRRITLDRRLSPSRLRFHWLMPGFEGFVTVRCWPNDEISMYLIGWHADHGVEGMVFPHHLPKDRP